MDFDIIIQGGTIHTAERSFLGDIAIRDGVIAAVATPGELDRSAVHARRRIDAVGMDIIPGCIDAHVHLDLDCGEGLTTCDDFDSGTRAAACGCVTTVIDFAAAEPGQSLLDAHDAWRSKADGVAHVDYTWHMSITRREQLREIPRIIELGIPTFKAYMIYESRGLHSDDAQIYATLELMRKHDGMLLVHAENNRVLDLLIRRNHTPARMRKHGAQLHAVTRPNFIEAEAIARAITWSEATGGKLYIVHVSTAEGADLIRAARRRGAPVLAETCAHFLSLTDDRLSRKDGHLCATCPQLKKKCDVDRLWQALADDDLSVVSTDTCSFTRKQKNTWDGDFTKIPMGMPGLDTLIPLLYTKGVGAGRISINRLVALCSTNPARIMGMGDRKGCIAPGYDADIAIIDPKRSVAVDHKTLQSRCDWSPYQGMKLGGFAHTTLLRGQVIVKNHRFVGRTPQGRFVPRTAP
ncbi:MAG: dihydropyrimidinase [Phycisphaerales bacterium]|nr:dihydropyrimidinase [Phycisphaerales bacterium]